jgi:hypothetical protein
MIQGEAQMMKTPAQAMQQGLEAMQVEAQMISKIAVA